jgi:hypothetical protein
VLSVGEKQDVCAYKEQYRGASQQATAKYFSLLWGTPISQCCVADVLRKRKQFQFTATPLL